MTVCVDMKTFVSQLFGMSLSAEIINRLKKIHPKDESLINGFVRANSIMIVPYAIIQICIAYFVCMDESDVNKKGKDLEISGMRNQICE